MGRVVALGEAGSSHVKEVRRRTERRGRDLRLARQRRRGRGQHDRHGEGGKGL